MSDHLRVLVVFADDSLGGTSRSALNMAVAWRQAGAVVAFCPLAGVHADRLPEFEAVGRVLDVAAVDVTDYHLLHFHHAQPTVRELEPLRLWVRQASLASSEDVPALLTHNVFGVDGMPVDAWPGPHAVGLLGTWLVEQFAASRWPRPLPPHVVVPNPQDLDFFRPPRPDERAAARTRLQIAAGAPVVLRVGSPISGKWSNAYVDLADAAHAAGSVLICVGAPEPLSRRLRRRPGTVRLLERSADAEWLRDLYWAADVLAVDSTQGESFGNVILEALGCGTPVVYRDRPARDNTPREFPITISRGRRRWVADVIEVGGRMSRVIDRAGIERYSIGGVAEELKILAEGRLDEVSLASASPDRGEVLMLQDRVAVALRHLPPGRTIIGAGRALKRAMTTRSTALHR